MDVQELVGPVYERVEVFGFLARGKYDPVKKESIGNLFKRKNVELYVA